MKTDLPTFDKYLAESGQGPWFASPIENPHSLSVSEPAPAVLTDYAGASCPARFRRSTYAGVMFVMGCCLLAAFLLLHFNHA